jgi:hypothetical protein
MPFRSMYSQPIQILIPKLSFGYHLGPILWKDSIVDFKRKKHGIVLIELIELIFYIYSLIIVFNSNFIFIIAK